MRELPAAAELNRPRDATPIELLPRGVWYCVHCDPPRPTPSLPTSVQWITGPDGSAFGRCRQCGQKYALGEHRASLPR